MNVIEYRDVIRNKRRKTRRARREGVRPADRRAQPANMGKTIEFTLGSQRMMRRLVAQVDDQDAEVNMDSVVGKALSVLKTGESVVVHTPGGSLVVKVLCISDTSVHQDR